ncbi:hypothetical protein EK21DRAFT_47841, partial [Setomelanomma holmii]
RVVPAPVRCKYVALSYVWGGAIPFKLRRSDITFSPDAERVFQNLSAHLDRRELPQTIKDAMFVVQAIGGKYLWVDCLCIVQDDVEELKGNIHQMHHIFSRAELTIVAAGGDVANAG